MFPVIRSKEYSIFDELISALDLPRRDICGIYAPLDVTKLEDKYVVKCDLPGVSKENIEINVHNGVLTISGNKEQLKEDVNEKSYFRERRFGKFSRSISISESVNTDDIKAAYADGVLELTIPIKPENKPKQITIS